jgi:DNA primase
VRFDERYLDEIKSRLRLSDVIGRTVKLRRQGREFAGLSPFTKEKTPSFYVNDEKGFYHCFSSGKHGDLISFLQETERLSFPEAVERLAAEAGVPLPAQDPRAAQEEKARQGLADWVELAAAWFEAELRRPVGAEARAYLERRGLPQGEWGKFRLGFAPDSRSALKDYLVAKGARPAELAEAGLLIAPEEGGAPYDRFRGRIIFPITDARGRVISFGGRAMDPSKSRIVYGLPEARRLLAAGEADAPLVVVEGYMDAIACQRAGVAGVAPLGTALTEEQMELLWRFHPEPTLCFDGDNAGRRAAARAIDRALPHLKPGRSMSFALVEGGKDPDEVLREQGAAALKAQLVQTTPFVEALFVRERDMEPLDTPERRAGLKGRLRTCAAQIQDKDLAQAYRDDLLARYDALFRRGPDASGAAVGSRPPPRPQGQRRWNAEAYVSPTPSPEGKAAAAALARALDPMGAAVAKAGLDQPDWLEDKLEALEMDGFGDPALSDLAREIIRLRLECDVLDSAGLARHLAAKGFGALLSEIYKAASKSGAPFLGSDLPPADARSQWSHAFDVFVRMASLERALNSAKAGMEGEAGVAAFMRLKAERDALKRAIRTGTLWADGGSI